MYTSTPVYGISYLDEQKRRKVLIEYIGNNQGCTKQHIDQDKDNVPISRKTIFKIIEDLKEDGIVDELTDRENSRDHKLYIIENNLLVSVPKELDEFEKAFTRLLDESKQRISRKDYSEIRRKIGINEPDPHKWQASDVIRYIKFEEEGARKMSEKARMVVRRTQKMKQKMTHLIEKFNTADQQSIPVSVFYETISILKKDLSDHKSMASQFRESLNYVHDVEISMLVQGAVISFYALVDAFFYRSTMIWPSVVNDKKTLQKIYNIVFTKISEIQLQLSEFLKSIKVLSVLDPFGFIINMRNDLTRNDLLLYLPLYRALGMEAIVEPVAESILKINTEIQKYRSSDFSIHQYKQDELDFESKVNKVETQLKDLERKLKSTNFSD